MIYVEEIIFRSYPIPALPYYLYYNYNTRFHQILGTDRNTFVS